VEIEVEQFSAAPGESVIVPIMLVANPGIAGLRLSVGYDSYRLRIDSVNSVTSGTALTYHMFVGVDESTYSRNPFNVIWIGVENDTSTGVLLNVEFSVPDNAPAGEATINVTVGMVVDYNSNQLSYSVTQGSVYILRDDDNGNGNGDDNGDDTISAPPPRPGPGPTPPPTPGPTPAPNPEPEYPESPYEAVTLPFGDVVETAWYYEYVRTVWENSLFQGTAYNQFSPQVGMTRAMFAQVLANLEGVDTSVFNNLPKFVDVVDSAWYFGAVEWAAGAGIVQGVGGDNFAPDLPITREQMVVMLFRYVEIMGIEIAQGYIANFIDQDEISYWAVDAVRAIQGADLVGGRPDGRFDPLSTATRAEVSAIFTRFLAQR